MTITTDTQVEVLLEQHPETVRYFILNKVSPFSCAGAYPKSLGEMLMARHVNDVAGFIAGLNAMIDEKRLSSDSTDNLADNPDALPHRK